MAISKEKKDIKLNLGSIYNQRGERVHSVSIVYDVMEYSKNEKETRRGELQFEDMSDGKIVRSFKFLDCETYVPHEFKSDPIPHQAQLLVLTKLLSMDIQLNKCQDNLRELTQRNRTLEGDYYVQLDKVADLQMNVKLLKRQLNGGVDVPEPERVKEEPKKKPAPRSYTTKLPTSKELYGDANPFAVNWLRQPMAANPVAEVAPDPFPYRAGMPLPEPDPNEPF